MTTTAPEYAGGQRTASDEAVLAASPAIRAFVEKWNGRDADQAMGLAMAELRRRSAQLTPPVGIQNLLPVASAHVSRTTMKTRGRLHATTSGWLIETDRRLGWRQHRFGVAHELGHVLLFEAAAGRPDLIHELHRDETVWKPVENLCDRAAGELLMPLSDLANQTKAEWPTTRTDMVALYDRYAVSPAVFMRRLCELDRHHTYSVWEHRAHGAKPADWRIVETYPRTRRRGTYLPNHLSASHLQPNLVADAAGTGFAVATGATITVGSRRHTGDMIAFNPRRRPDEVLPIYEGHVILDDYAPSVHLLIRHTSAGPISLREKFG